MSESQMSCVQVNEARAGSPDNPILIANEKYAKAWTTIIPRCGGRLVGYFLPLEGTSEFCDCAEHAPGFTGGAHLPGGCRVERFHKAAVFL
jgi:hypothetical protein